MSQLLTRKTRSRKKSLDMEGSQISEEKQSLGATKSCSVNVMKENPESQNVMEKQTALVIDDIIDDFDLEDELKEDTVMDTDDVDLSGTHFNGVNGSEQNSEKEQDSASDCYTDDIEEEAEEEEEEDMVRRENVIRCKMYRDNKKMELINSEKELND